MEGTECDSVGDADAEQLATAHCTRTQQSGGGYVPVKAKACLRTASG